MAEVSREALLATFDRALIDRDASLLVTTGAALETSAATLDKLRNQPPVEG